MSRVIGVDAAWTERGSTGVAVATVEPGRRPRLERVTRSYAEMQVDSVDWHRPPPRPMAGQDLSAVLRSGVVDAVAVDIPLSREPITGRRTTDNEISRHYGARGASTHTPSASRPGPVSAKLFHELTGAGFALLPKASPLSPAPSWRPIPIP